LRGLSKRFAGKPPTTAVDNLHLDIDRGEFVVLLGPSGCGKTTTLRCLAGLETPDAGSISFGDRIVFDAAAGVNAPPNKRNIGMVFQSYALWPHMSVRKNIGYPLHRHRTMHADVQERVKAIAEIVECSDLLDRYPGQLSGGQQQRVALARGLVARPDLVLFDEPLSNLDARLRDQVRAQLHELHQRLRFTAVFVTHDQTEALALGDRLAIMRSGMIEQFATPQQVFEEPNTEYVAGFMGMSNRLALERSANGWVHDGQRVGGQLPSIGESHATVVVRARPDDLMLTPPGAIADPNAASLSAKVVDSAFGGSHMDVVVSVGKTRLQARIPVGSLDSWARSLAIGQSMVVSFRGSDVTFYDSVGGRLPATPRRFENRAR
jgi:iron(III) transport system ATP-binding protein